VRQLHSMRLAVLAGQRPASLVTALRGKLLHAAQLIPPPPFSTIFSSLQPSAAAYSGACRVAAAGWQLPSEH
jgi:hypothetical protein